MSELVSARAIADKKQLTITDTGIGMSKEDMVQNLGTIARSGRLLWLCVVDSCSVVRFLA
jgi:HSP90 family molecular chaperone